MEQRNTGVNILSTSNNTNVVSFVKASMFSFCVTELLNISVKCPMAFYVLKKTPKTYTNNINNNKNYNA